MLVFETQLNSRSAVLRILAGRGRILVAGGEAEEGSIRQGKGGGRYKNKKA